ncbi:hypothetical protein RIF29_39213 [Crotalaria pallida]|uniref:Ninja-family protein n=1 Tax=Crotalaria pallida TaxID=3830 RepID=A0AAN9E385_CROPI
MDGLWLLDDGCCRVGGKGSGGRKLGNLRAEGKEVEGGTCVWREEKWREEGGASSSAQTSPKQDIGNPVKMLIRVNPCPYDDTMKVLKRMPTVTTAGDGIYGKRIQEILYNYEQGEICIVCACNCQLPNSW